MSERDSTLSTARGDSSLTLPSWSASVAAHALLLILFAASLRSCGRGGASQVPGEEFREVGLVVKSDDTNRKSDEPSDADAGNPNRQQDDAREADPGRSRSAVPDQPPVPLELPEDRRQTIGPGGRGGVVDTGNDAQERLQSSGVASRAAAIAGLEQGETRFFGIEDKGERFVYLLDVSGSMDGPPLLAAKSQLLASLETLDQTQQFQALFYFTGNRGRVKILRLELRGDDEREIYYATGINKTLARGKVKAVTARGGTDHRPALLEALRLKPDVLFFLSDNGEPRLSARDLVEVTRANDGATRIHCVEFGTGSEPRSSRMRQLADDNRGAYRYFDVHDFE